MADVLRVQDSYNGAFLSVALIGPDEQSRRAMAVAIGTHPRVIIHEFPSYSAGLEQLPQLLADRYHLIVVDADSNPDSALELAETVCTSSNTSVMAYSSRADVKLAIRFMRVGVREFFTMPVVEAEIVEALNRASTRQPVPQHAERIASKVLVFLGTKGGCGVTALASNFAVALAQESERSTLLLDLGLPLGDAAINLGMVTEFSVANALREIARLDSNFLRTLLATHASGLSVLAAPSDFRADASPDIESMNKMLAIARLNFEYIVVDVGSRLDLLNSALFDETSIVYLITQVGISELRNANRMISQFFPRRTDNLQIVLNRYKPATMLFDDKHIEKALTRPAQWKIPDDYQSARRTQNTATPMALADSPIALSIRQMARTVCGRPAEKEEKKGLFSFFR